MTEFLPPSSVLLEPSCALVSKPASPTFFADQRRIIKNVKFKTKFKHKYSRFGSAYQQNRQKFAVWQIRPKFS
ncbi:hypothetical protein CAMRE0001_2784 [Campylobacter rectus RM3267]|uniref:Uncharacterized protein n=1 Tax=Campylobacter rectus RM3267 TaxID=553218 RepID=B9D0X9_CAMRE|nr:hypothetical protein CAMRE0001_2784 [Campylobacter rectus RM3267]